MAEHMYFTAKKSFKTRSLTTLLCVSLLSSMLVPVDAVLARDAMMLPVPGAPVSLGKQAQGMLMTGVRIFPDDPFRFDFMIDEGRERPDPATFRGESELLVKYFLASLAIPDRNFWVNLSPYEQNRIIDDEFGMTDMGRDMLAQDYLLKQVTSSLTCPEGETGERFWSRVYAEVYKRFGRTDISVEASHRVWIIPESAEVFSTDNAAVVVNSRLKVMLEEDYYGALNASATGERRSAEAQDAVSADMYRKVLLPVLEREVNEGEHFKTLRQMYNALILATWYKRHLRASLFGRLYVDREKVRGIDETDAASKEKIYELYLESFRRGVYNVIRKERDPYRQRLLRRKYFSGGIQITDLSSSGVYREVRDRSVLMTADGVVPARPGRAYRVSSVVVSGDRSFGQWWLKKLTGLNVARIVTAGRRAGREREKSREDSVRNGAVTASENTGDDALMARIGLRVKSLSREYREMTDYIEAKVDRYVQTVAGSSDAQLATQGVPAEVRREIDEALRIKLGWMLKASMYQQAQSAGITDSIEEFARSLLDQRRTASLSPDDVDERIRSFVHGEFVSVVTVALAGVRSVVNRSLRDDVQSLQQFRGEITRLFTDRGVSGPSITRADTDHLLNSILQKFTSAYSHMYDRRFIASIHKMVHRVPDSVIPNIIGYQGRACRFFEGILHDQAHRQADLIADRFVSTLVGNGLAEQDARVAFDRDLRSLCVSVLENRLTGLIRQSGMLDEIEQLKEALVAKLSGTTSGNSCRKIIDTEYRIKEFNYELSATVERTLAVVGDEVASERILGACGANFDSAVEYIKALRQGEDISAAQVSAYAGDLTKEMFEQAGMTPLDVLGREGGDAVAEHEAGFRTVPMWPVHFAVSLAGVAGLLMMTAAMPSTAPSIPVHRSVSVLESVETGIRPSPDQSLMAPEDDTSDDSVDHVVVDEALKERISYRIKNISSRYRWFSDYANAAGSEFVRMMVLCTDRVLSGKGIGEERRKAVREALHRTFSWEVKAGLGRYVDTAIEVPIDRFVRRLMRDVQTQSLSADAVAALINTFVASDLPAVIDGAVDRFGKELGIRFSGEEYRSYYQRTIEHLSDVEIAMSVHQDGMDADRLAREISGDLAGDLFGSDRGKTEDELGRLTPQTSDSVISRLIADQSRIYRFFEASLYERACEQADTIGQRFVVELAKANVPGNDARRAFDEGLRAMYVPVLEKQLHSLLQANGTFAQLARLENELIDRLTGLSECPTDA
jgi:hypothetical protein